MRTAGWRTVSAMSVLAITAGCSTVASEDLRTSGMIAHISVTATSSGALVNVDLTAGGTTSVELGPHDSLVASAGGRRVVLRESTLLGNHVYGGTVPVAAKPGTTVKVELQRADDTSTTSIARLPGPVGLAAPADGSRVPRSRDLRLRVAPGPGSFRVDWKGSCVGVGEVRFAEGEPLVLPRGSIQKAAPASGAPAVPEACDVTLTVSRTVDGRLGSAYKSGSIEGVRMQSIAIRSVS